MDRYKYLPNEQSYVVLKWTRRGKPCALMALVDNGMTQMDDGAFALASKDARAALRDRARVKRRLELVNGAWQRIARRRR